MEFVSICVKYTCHAECRLQEALMEDKGTGCDIPKDTNMIYDVRENIKKKYQKCIICRKKSWVTCYMSICRLKRKIVEKVRRIECFYSDMVFSDQKVRFLEPKALKGDKIYHLNRSDHVGIHCTGLTGTKLIESSWSGYGFGFRRNVDRIRPQNGTKNYYQVLMFGFANTSKKLFIEHMPLSYKFLTNLGGTIMLNGYNTLSREAAATLFPILSGKSEFEMSDAGKHEKKENRFLDEKQFIFHWIKQLGYRTAYFEDRPWTEIHRHIKGFVNQPADHYLGDIFGVKYETEWYDNRQQPYFCFDEKPRFKHIIELTKQFFNLEGHHFSFTYISDIIQTDCLFRHADKPFAKFLQGLDKTGVFQDTLLIIMGDHGASNSAEQRLPFMAIRLPDKLRASRPVAQLALDANMDVLTTPHDIHATILDALDLTTLGNPYMVQGADLPRALSLLKPVPRIRSCSEAGIEVHWCTCHSWQHVGHMLPMYGRVVRVLIEHINNLTLSVRNLCVEWTLGFVISVNKRQVNKQSFMDQNSQTNASVLNEVYQAKVTLKPGGINFEATMIYLARKNIFLIGPNAVSRNDETKTDTTCLSKEYAHLKDYCSCDPSKVINNEDTTVFEPELFSDNI